MKFVPFIIVILASTIAISGYAQGYLKTEYTSSSTYRDRENNIKGGSSDLMKIEGGFNLPISVKQTENGRVRMWAASLNAAYGSLNTKDLSADLCPSEIVNANLGITFLTPISRKWSLLSALGGGVYAAPNNITSKSILGNGGVVFICHMNPTLDLGVGLGVTNSFGIPMAMPMMYLSWRPQGKYDVAINLTNGLEISGAMKVNDWFKLRLVAAEMDGMASVVEIDGKSAIMGIASIKSSIRPEFKLGKAGTVYLSGGANWARSITVHKRSLKGFTDSFKEKEDPYFGVAGYCSVGYKYGF